MGERATDQPTLDELVSRTAGLRPWRRIFHLVGGLAVAWLVVALSPRSDATRWLFGSILAVALIGDLARLRSEVLNRAAFRTFEVLFRPREVDSLSLSWYMLGVFLTLWIPDGSGVAPALVVLAVADPAAGFVGQKWGRRRLGKGSLVGSLVFLLAATTVLAPFVSLSEAILVALVATVAEALPTPLDDNLVIPVVTALTLWAL